MPALEETITRQRSDKILVARARQGCLESFEQLVERYHRKLVRFVFGKIRNQEDAEEIVQDAFLKAYHNLGRFNSNYAFTTWLFTITRNCMISHLRKGSRKPVMISLNDETSGLRLSTPPAISDEETGQRLWQAARELGEDQYLALWLRYNEKMDMRSIASVMGKSSIHVRVLLHRARGALGRKIRQES